jgi:arabinogalactan endo-1,4-beta-galactosidase
MGADLSYVNEIEDFGGKYYEGGLAADPFMIFAKHGCNTIRVRLWYNPSWLAGITGGKLYSDLADVEKTIRRAHENKMAVNLDFHYSDTWADPGQQEAPAAWKDLVLTVLSDSVYQYTLRVLQYLGKKGQVPEMVQIGNETNPGMLFPNGKIVNENWSGFATLLKAGIRAVRQFSVISTVKPQIILHVAQFQNAEWWIEGLVNKGKVNDFDILGISHYAKWSTANRMDIIADKISNIRIKYGKKVMIVETAYPWTGLDADGYTNIVSAADSVAGYPLTPEGQLKYLTDLTQTIISSGGSGLHYWEPAWITSSMKDKWGTGSAWDNCTLFDFQGNSLKGMGFMLHSYHFPK